MIALNEPELPSKVKCVSVSSLILSSSLDLLINLTMNSPIFLIFSDEVVAND